MSVDAGLHLRWPEGLAPDAEELARLLDITYEAQSRAWGRATAPDGGSTMWVRISADPTDRIGPSPAPDDTPDRFAERPYDHWLHLTPAERPPYPEDTFAVLRAHCRAAVDRLRRHGLVESAFDIDDPAGYWTSARAAFGPELPTDVLLDVRWAAETLTTPTLPAGLTPNLHPAPADPSRTIRLIPPPTEAADAVTESLALRAAELPFHHTARFTGHRVAPEELDAFSDRLVAELTRPGEQTDVTLWINDRLTRHEAAVQPVTDLRLLA